MTALAGELLRLTKGLILILCLLLLSSQFSQQAFAATFNIGPGDTNGLISAINSSNSNGESDVINLETDSSYELTAINNFTYSKNGLPVISSEIVINGNNSTIVRNSSEEFRILIIDSGELTLNNIKITNGYDSDPLYPTIYDNFGGGGILIINGVLKINSSTISNNRADVGGGGGLWQGGNSSVAISNSVISNNTLGRDGSGGGILKRGRGTTEIKDTEITENNAFNAGGAIYAGNDIFDNSNGGLIYIENSKVKNNFAKNYGGAIFNFSGQFKLMNTHINDNRTLNSGGFLYNYDLGTITGINNSCISGNSNTALVNFGTQIPAQQNWWGAIDGPSGIGPGSGDSISGDVNYSNPLSSCPPLVSPSPTPSPSPSPSPSPTPNPVVILPGMGGSWNTLALITGSAGGNWKKTPFIKIYDNLKNTFLNAGYTENQDYFEFYYDWRKRVENLADDLNNYLGIVLNNQPPETKVDLVGHSLGGLIARAYAQKYGVEKIDNLVTTGSPHEGAAPAYLAWAGAAMDESFSWESIGLELYLHLHQGRYSSPVIAVQNLSPSLKDMLPIFDFAKHSDGMIIPVNSMQTVNDYLLELKENLNSGLTDLMTTIAGSEKETVEWIKLRDRSVSDRLLNRWLDGKPTAYEYTKDGDSTVLSKSALIESTDQETVLNNHVNLVQTQAGIDAIMATLGIDTQARTDSEQPNRTPSLFFLLHSPAEITVTDPNGDQAGFGIDKPMTNSFYSQEDKLLLIYNALAGEYQTTITGTGNGSYQLEIGQLTNNGNYWSSLVDEIQTASTDVWTVNFDSQNPLSDPVVDQSGISKIDQAKLRLERLKSQTNRKLANYLNKIIKLLDKRQNLSALRLALTSTYKFRYWIDRFGQSNTSLKDEADQIGQLLNQALVTVGQNSRQKLTKKQAGAELRTAQLTKERVEDGAEKINGINLPLGNTLDLMNRYFDRAQTSFDQTKYWQTHADALVVRVLAIEASALIK